GDSDGDQSRAHHAERVALDEPPRPPVAFQVSADEPEREHVEKHMTEAGVQQRVRDHLPHFAMHHGNRNQRQPLPHLNDNVRGKILHHLLEQIDPRASQNDASHPSCKWGKAERDGLSATHFTSLSFWLRHNWQTAMSRRIYRAHTEYHI